MCEVCVGLGVDLHGGGAGSSEHSRHNRDGGDAWSFLNADERGGAGTNGKTSFTVDEAAAHLTRSGASWNGTGVLNDPAVVTYAYRASAAKPMPSGTSGFSKFTEVQINQTELSLQTWSDVANITFLRVGSGTSGTTAYSNNATMLFGNYARGANGAAAFAYYPGSTASNSYSGDVWVNSSLSYNAVPELWNYGRTVLVHEIGHAIGLAHPGDYNAGSGGTITYSGNAEYYEDTRQYSAMSYFSETNTGGDLRGSYPAAPQLDDIAAVQRLYGANMTTRVGDTTYGFNSNAGRDFYLATTAKPVIFAVWDAGGNDTLDFSGYSQNQVIDLAQGAFSSVGGSIGNVAIAMGVVIENAIGGSGSDRISGNEAANSLTGNGGADILAGEGGADRFIYKAVSDSTPGAADRILDFGPGDVIDLSAIDADASTAGDQAFLLVSIFGGQAGEAVLSYDAASNTTSFRGDVNGDGVADFELLLTGQVSTTEGWLL
jgi:serralysin